jgi:hypothetical protein
MALSFSDQRRVSRDESIREYDRLAEHAVPSVAFIRDELFRRDLVEQNDRMEQMTREMARLTNLIRWLTVLITVLTAISTAAPRTKPRLPRGERPINP